MTSPPVEWTVDSDSPGATLAIGQAIGRSLAGGIVIALVGPLGAGKTQLVKGIADGNANRHLCEVTSPTFTLVHEYPGRLTLYHLDLYRLSSAAELASVELDELIRSDSAVVIEWADRMVAAVPDDALWITMTPTGPSSRRFSLRPDGERSDALLRSVRGAGVDIRDANS